MGKGKRVRSSQKRNQTSQKRDHGTTLGRHTRQKKKLLPPFLTLPAPLGFASWHNDALPDVLWAAVLASNLDRGECLELFRKVVTCGREKLSDNGRTYISHSVLSTLSEEQFDTLMGPVLLEKRACEILSGLLLFEKLPDSKHWKRHLRIPNPDKDWDVLAKAIFETFDHQSQVSTDCRWLKVVYMLAIGKLHLPSGADEMAREFIEYPNFGDQKKVRPLIRSTELGFRSPDVWPKAPTAWNKDFWTDCWEKSPCILQQPRKPIRSTSTATAKDFMEIYNVVVQHYQSTDAGSEVDPRHDGAFGLVLYGIYLGMSASRGDIEFRAEGRIVLRSLVEALITLKYLSKKDNKDEWKRYRNYGAGQSKLSLLKNINNEDIPSFVNIDELERYSNEDIWMELQDIDLGSWNNKSLRSMSQEIGCKAIYDQYYDWSSAFVHSNWGAVRDTVFQNCLNPLHKFHRVVSFPRIDMNGSNKDLVKLANMMLGDLNRLYPGVTARLREDSRSER